MSDIVDPTRASQPGAEATQGAGAVPGGYPSPPSKRGSLGRFWALLHGLFTLMRFLLRRFLWVTVRVGRGVWRHPILTLVSILAVVLAFQGYQRFLAPPPAPVDPGHYEIVQAIPPPLAVAEYLSAQKNFDADAMWNTYSEQAKAANLAQGSSLQTLRQTTQQLQIQGLEYGDSHYIGGYQIQQGSHAYYFYVTKVRDPKGNAAEIYQIFIADDDGKVLRVEQPQLSQAVG